MITSAQLAKLRSDLGGGNEILFYNSKAWARVRAEVLKLDHYECQKCKAEGKFHRAEIVHHVHHLKDFPEMALDIYDADGNRNLVSVCKYHHELEHPESMKQMAKGAPLTAERWD